MPQQNDKPKWRSEGGCLYHGNEHVICAGANTPEEVGRIVAMLNEREKLRAALQLCVDAGYWDTSGRNAIDSAQAALAASEPATKEHADGE